MMESIEKIGWERLTDHAASRLVRLHIKDQMSADNYTVYRTIMGIFYLERQKMHYQMVRDTVLVLLRGNNAAGKSITTQSFVPFILNGDKRPERLDPFSSRDRKMEFYLLGDNKRGESTGYLYLEFRKPGTERITGPETDERSTMAHKAAFSSFSRSFWTITSV